MGKTSEKLSYLNGTKRLLRRRINSLGGNITLDTKFRDYLLWLDRFYNAASSSVEFEILGETKQYAVNSSANILPLYDDEIVTDGVTVTISNGKITMNGTATRNMWIKLTNGIEVIYEDPFSNDGHSYYDTYGWLSDEVLSYNPSETKYLQFAHGTGTAPTGASNPGPYTACGMYCVIHTDSSIQPDWTFSDYEDLINRDNVYNDKDVIQTRKATNLNKVNCVFLAINQGLTINEYFYFQICDAHETVWTPNYDALAPSPDNPKYFRVLDDITYTASDGTEFPIWLTYPDAPYNFVLGSIGDYKDRIYYKNGKFYCERKIGSVTLNGSETWWANGETTNYGQYAMNLTDKGFGVSNLISSHFITNLSNSKNCIAGRANNNVIAITIEKSIVNYNASTFKTWLSTHNTEVYYVLDEPVITEIENTNDNKTIYDQLKAIIDHETKLEIEEKIF